MRFWKPIVLVVFRAEAIQENGETLDYKRTYLAFPETGTPGPTWTDNEKGAYCYSQEYDWMAFGRARELDAKVAIRLPGGREIPVEERDILLNERM